MVEIYVGFTLFKPIFAFKFIFILLKDVFLHPAVFQCLNLYRTTALIATRALGLAVRKLLKKQLLLAAIRDVDVLALIRLDYSRGALKNTVPRKKSPVIAIRLCLNTHWLFLSSTLLPLFVAPSLIARLPTKSCWRPKLEVIVDCSNDAGHIVDVVSISLGLSHLRRWPIRLGGTSFGWKWRMIRFVHYFLCPSVLMIVELLLVCSLVPTKISSFVGWKTPLGRAHEWWLWTLRCPIVIYLLITIAMCKRVLAALPHFQNINQINKFKFSYDLYKIILNLKYLVVYRRITKNFS